MRVLLRMLGVCALVVGCGAPLPEESPPEEVLSNESDESAPGEVSAQWKRPLPPLGPATLLKDIYPPPEEPSPGPFGTASPTELTAFRDSLFFSAVDFETDTVALWRSDGTPESTVPLKPIPNGPFRLTVVGSQLFFTQGFGDESDSELWVSDGTAPGTRVVRTFPPEPARTLLHSFTAVGDTLFFVRDLRGPTSEDIGRQELWRSDGTPEGTVRVKDLGPEFLRLLELEAVEDRLFFSFETPETGVELWVSDGTEAGTRLVKDLFPGTSSSFPFHMTPAGGVLYFTAEDSEHGRELWRSDGTAKGTVLIEDLRRGPEGSDPQPITEFKGRLYFAVLTPDREATELRKLDPDPTCHPRSRRVALLPSFLTERPEGLSLFVPSSTVTERKLFFTLDYDVGSPSPLDTQLWSTDGTRRGTRLLHRPLVNAEGLAVPTPAPTDDGRVVFHAYDEAHGHELWVSDGTPSGTRLLQDIVPGPASSYPQDLLRAGDFIYFTAKEAVHDREIWVLPVPPSRGAAPTAGR